MDSIEKLWDDLLSRDAERIKQAYGQFNTDQQKEILDHLVKMTTKPGWHVEQKLSALAAIEAINALEKESK
jgi:hypothetical protein